MFIAIWNDPFQNICGEKSWTLEQIFTIILRSFIAVIL